MTAKGGTAHDVVVCDKLPAHMTFASLGTATIENGKACWTVGDLTGSLVESTKPIEVFGEFEWTPAPPDARIVCVVGVRQPSK